MLTSKEGHSKPTAWDSTGVTILLSFHDNKLFGLAIYDYCVCAYTPVCLFIPMQFYACVGQRAVHGRQAPPLFCTLGTEFSYQAGAARSFTP